MSLGLEMPVDCVYYDGMVTPRKAFKHKPGPKTELGGEPVRRYQVMLDARTIKLLDVIGGGNRSYGIRRAVDAAYDLYQRDQLK